jgi:zinc protease
MKRLLGGAILLILMACSPNKKGVFPYEIHQKKLANGLNIIAIPFDSPGLVSYSMAMRVGSRNEVEEGVTGFAHFFEHLMFYGSKKRNKNQAATYKKAMGAGGNAYTWDDQTIYHLTGNSKKLENFFELFSDNFKNLYFTEDEFKREAGAVLGEYTKNFSGWYRQINAKLREKMFKVHTYGHTTMGYEKDIKDMPNQFEYAWKFYKRFYRPEYASVIVVGDIKVDEVFKLAEKYYGDWEKGDYVSDIKPEPKQEKEIIAHMQRGDVLPVLLMGYRIPAYMENLKEAISLQIISDLLASSNSRLYQRLVNEEQKAKSFWAFSYEKRDPHYFSILFRADRGKQEDLKYLKAEFEKEMEIIISKAQDQKFLKDLKSNKKYSFLGGLNNPQDIALQVAETYQVSGDPNTLNTYFDVLEKITAEDIMNTAKKYFRPENRTLVTMTADEKGLF